MDYIEIFALFLLVSFIFHLIMRPRIGLNEPPLVPYRFPVIGHTYDFLYNSENFFKECREKYGDPFSLYVYGSIRTFTGADSTPEVLKHSDVFDFTEGVNKISPIIDVFNNYIKDFSMPYFTRVVRDQISGKTNIYRLRMQKELLSGIEKYIGDCKEPKTIKNVREVSSRLIAKPIANVMLGEEGAQFEDLIVSFTSVERELQMTRFAPKILLFIHPSLYRFVVKLSLKFGSNPMDRHRDLFVQRCKPFVEERIRQRKELGKLYIQKEDLLDFFISESETDVVDDILMDKLFGSVYFLVFTSINTTTRALAFVLFDYGGRPELWNELYEEQLKIQNESNGDYLSAEDVDKMVKLDSFLKESFRYSSEIASLPHSVIGDSYTFSNGTTIPKGREVYVYMKDIAFNNRFFGNTTSNFQPERYITSFSNGKIVYSPATKVDRTYITFGGGKHSCPGRYFVVNEMKMGLHKLILKYNIRTESGKIASPVRIAANYFPPNSGLIFENRN